jgi:hypothetical protein
MTKLNVELDYVADVLIIERPRGWKPESYCEVPPGPFRSLWLEESGTMPLEDALAIRFGFNCAALKDGGNLWALVLASWKVASMKATEQEGENDAS